MFRNANKKVGEIDKTGNNEIEDEKIYFYEIPYLKLEELNTLTRKINYTFIYLTKDNYNNKDFLISNQLKY